jgi:hypothetical protein
MEFLAKSAPDRRGIHNNGAMDQVTRRVAVAQLLGMSAPELLERAAALRHAELVPPWAETVVGVLEEQAELASALGPLRVEFDDAEWHHLGVLVAEGLEPDHAAALVRASGAP